MELLRAMPYDGFRALEAALIHDKHITLDRFTEAVLNVADRFDFRGKVDEGITRRYVQSLYHQIDFNDRREITWEMVTMHIIDDAFRATGHNDTLSDREDFRYHARGVAKQASSRVRHIQYVKPWQRLLRSVSGGAVENVIELSPLGSIEGTAKSSKPLHSPIMSLAAVTSYNTIAASHADMTCSFHTCQLHRDGLNNSRIVTQRVVPRKEVEESVTSFLWHENNNVLYSGSRGGNLVSWNVRVDRATSERFTITGRKSLCQDGISCMLASEQRVVAGCMDSLNNICVYDPEKELVLERLKGHCLGVMCMGWSAEMDLLVSAGFERVPHLWVFKIRDFPPWRLIDKTDPHKSDIVFVECPPQTHQVISGDERGLLKVWDVRTFKCIQTLSGDVPPVQARGDEANAEAITKQLPHYNAVAFHDLTHTIVSCGPQSVHQFRRYTPRYLDCADDKAVVAVLYNPTMRCFITAHGTSVKLWDEDTGAVSTRYLDIAEADITAMCQDNRGRKLYIGTRKGHITGHVIATGKKFRDFRTAASEVLQLAYGITRKGQKTLLAVCAEEFIACDDGSLTGRQVVVAQPLQVMRMHLLHATTAPAAREHRMRMLTYQGITTQSKLSVCYLWAKRFVVAVDLATLTVIHFFHVDSDVACVAALGDLPAVAILDRRNCLYVYAVRPSLIADELLVKKNLNLAPEEEETLSTSTAAALRFSRTLSLRDMSEATLLMSLVQSQSAAIGDDDDVPALKVNSCLTYLQSRRTLHVADTTGYLWEWDVSHLIKMCALSSTSYPIVSISEAVMRKRHCVPDSRDAARSILLVNAFPAHSEEIRSVQVLFSHSSTKLVTAGNDRRVKVWGTGMAGLGELSQGRHRFPETLDPDVVRQHYERHNIAPFRYCEAAPEQDSLLLADLSSSVQRLLIKFIHRYRANRDSKNHLKGSGKKKHQQPLLSDGDLTTEVTTSFPVAAEPSNVVASPEGHRFSIVTRLPESKVPVVTQEALVAQDSMQDAAMLLDAVATLGANATPPPLSDNVKMFRAEAGFSSDFQAFPRDLSSLLRDPPKARKRIQLDTSTSGAFANNQTLLTALLQPPTTATAAPHNNNNNDASNSHKRTAPGSTALPSLQQRVTQRKDLPLTFSALHVQDDVCRETKERTMARHLGIEWQVYEKTINFTSAGQQPRALMDGARRATSLRRAPHLQTMVPPLDLVPVKPPLHQVSHVPKSAREAELEAVDRLLGNAGSSSARAPQRNRSAIR